MKEVFIKAQDFLNAVFRNSGFELHANVSEGGNGVLHLDIDGVDATLLRNENGELLDALEQLINQIFSHELKIGERIVCDVQGFRALRETELRAMARHAANRVRASGLPFTFGAMNANERRIIHLSLSQEEDLQTESIGEGNARRLKVSIKRSI